MPPPEAAIPGGYPAEHPRAGTSESLRLEPLDARAALLTNFVAPYFYPVLLALQNSVSGLRVFASTRMEEGRPWESLSDGLDVMVQKSITTHHARTYEEGFTEKFVRHFPYDTLPLLRRYKPDVVVSAQLGFRTIQAAVYRLLNRDCRLVIWADLSEHTEKEVGAAQESMRRVLLSRADAVIVSGHSGFEYIRMLGLPGNRIVIAPYVTEMAPFSATPAAKDPRAARRLLYAGQLIERKGLEIFLPVLFEWGATHANESFEMWLVGDGPLRKRLEELPRPANVALRFFGNVPYNEIPSYCASAGIFVLPTLCDTWGLVVNEALAAGLPVLGSEYSQAVEELVTNGSNGWTFRADRLEEVRRALAKAMSSPLPKLAEMSRNARQSVSHLTPEYSAACFLRAIRVARSSARPSRRDRP